MSEEQLYRSVNQPTAILALLERERYRNPLVLRKLCDALGARKEPPVGESGVSRKATRKKF